MSLTVTMGIPGSGKTTWATRYAQRTGALLLSTDEVRTHQRDVIACLQRIAHDAETALTEGRPVVIDACNTQTQQRRRWLRIATTTDTPAHLVVIAHDPALAHRRNAARPTGQRVPQLRLDAYINDWPRAIRIARREPWDDILTIPVATEPAPATRTW